MCVALTSVPHRIIVSDDDANMTIGEVCERFRLSRSWIERKSRNDVLTSPKPLQFGGKTSARRWRRADVIAWEAERAKINGSAS
jgi:predicted DNA-binding transcriptional regulator AlpA